MATTWVFLIFLLPLLVQGADRDSFHDPAHNANRPQSPLTLQSKEHLEKVDSFLDVIKLPRGTTYQILNDDSTITPLPTDDYYRASSIIVIKTNGVEEERSKRRHFIRAEEANISQDRLAFLASSLSEISTIIPTLPINHFIYSRPPSKNNDYYLQVLKVPLGSEWHLGPTGVSVLITTDKYFQLPPKAIVTTPIGIFENASGQVVRSVGYEGVDDELLEKYTMDCSMKYIAGMRQIAESHTNRRLIDGTFVDRCIKHMWDLVVQYERPVRFSPPPFQWKNA